MCLRPKQRDDRMLAGIKTATCWPVIEGLQTHIGKSMHGRAQRARVPVASVETVKADEHVSMRWTARSL